MSLTSHQQEIFDSITKDLSTNFKQYFIDLDNINKHLYSLTGAAGTGKSFLTVKIVDYVIRVLQASPYSYDNIWITAPTHKAVGILRKELRKHNIMKVQCATIHSFLKLKLKRDLNTGAEKYVADKFDQNQNRASLLIVDESSMLSEELYDLIVEAVETRRVHEVVFIGDPYQLLPVSDGKNKVYSLKQQYQLTQIVRQKADNDIITLSQKLKNCIKEQDFTDLDTLFEGIVESKDIEIFSDKVQFIEDFYKNKDWYKEDKIFTSFTNETVESLNERIRQQYWLEQGIEDPDFLMKGDTIRFKSSLNDDGINSLNTNGVFINDEEVVLGAVSSCMNLNLGIKYWRCEVEKRKNSTFYVLDPDSLITFNKTLQNIAIDAKNTQAPFHKKLWRRYFGLKSSFANIQYHYATTIHKSQGSTYDIIYIDLNSLLYNTQIDDDFKYRLIYVAITRARSKVKFLY